MAQQIIYLDMATTLISVDQPPLVDDEGNPRVLESVMVPNGSSAIPMTQALEGYLRGSNTLKLAGQTPGVLKITFGN